MKTKIGATRIVFIFNKIVIKIPNIKEYRLFLHGILANMQEYTFYKRSKREDLAKVYFISPLGLFIIMRKAKVFCNKVNHLNFLNMIEDKYKNDVMKDFMLSDCKVTNWGIINKKLVKIDYGN